MTKYEVIIYLSNKDNIYIAEIPQLKGCMAHGETPNDALNEVTKVATEWVQIANEQRWPVPEPKGRLMYV